MSAPFCVIPTGPTINDQPGLNNFPPIPQPVDLPSALVAINALRQIVMQLIGQVPIGGSGSGASNPNLGGLVGGLNPGIGGGGLASDGSGGSSKIPGNGKNTKNGQARFVEDRGRRVTEKKRIYDPEDKTQYIDVEIINQVVWTDRLSNQTIVWQR